MGFTNTTYGVLDKSSVQVTKCPDMAKNTWLVDNKPTTSQPSGFVMKYNFDTDLFLYAKSVASDTTLAVVDTSINVVLAASTTFYTSGCTHANNTKAKPRGGT